MPKLRTLIQQNKPPKVITVGDVVSRETLATGIQVNLRIVDQMTLRKSISPVEIKAERVYRVRNPAGVVTKEAWDAIKEALQHREAVVYVDGEEDLQDLAVGDDLGIEGDLDDFGVASAAAANLLVRRVRHVPAGVPGDHALDTTQLVVHGFETPEAAAAERGRLEPGFVVGSHTIRV